MQISKNLLSMSCVISEVTGLDADRNPVYSAPTELNKIWLSYEVGTTNGSNGKENADTMVLFYDVTNSAPSGFIFKIGQKVVYNNATFTIKKIKPCYGLNGLEHYEAELW